MIEFPIHHNRIDNKMSRYIYHQIVDINQMWLIERACQKNSEDDKRTNETFEMLVKYANIGAQHESGKVQGM